MNEELPLTDIERHHNQRYMEAAHAVQTGVLMEIEAGLGPVAGDGEVVRRAHKHLRTGINCSLVDSSALGRLLVRKGLIGREEYFRALAEGMEEEVRRLEARLSDHYQRKVSLG